MINPDVSVIICTHNPRPDYLSRTLEALQQQTLTTERWELLLIDNASDCHICSGLTLSWHPNTRVIREETLGLTPARLRGIQESKGSCLIFVDDDNLLKANYLEQATQILFAMPWLGAIGGQILPEYEVAPPDWLFPYERFLAIRRANRAKWSNSLDDWEAQPWGAGLVIRREVCERYQELLHQDVRRRNLDRQGTQLLSGGDTDMVFTCRDLRLGFGVFPELVVTHLIPPRRMTEEYILKIVQGHSTSRLLLPYLRGEGIPNETERRSLYTEVRRLYHYLKRPLLIKKVEAAMIAGEQNFQALIEGLDSQSTNSS